jgi:hypothetical protein
LRGAQRPRDEVVRALVRCAQKAGVEGLKELAKEFFHTESIAVTVLGNLNALKLSRDQLAC